MKMIFAAAIAILLSSQSLAWADAVAGDSIGVGVGMASGLTSVAAVSASIGGGAVPRQLSRISSGSTVYLFLGTNNVASKAAPVSAVRDIANRARQLGLHLVWVGPPCMRSKRLGRYVNRFDRSLSSAVQGSGIRYVSLNQREHCSLERSSDGVHFSGQGYRTIWGMVH